MRLWIGPALELDEAEAFWFSRNLALGYGAQPPFYFWLQWAMFQIFGETILALAALKAVLLSVIFIALYRLLLTAFPVFTAGLAAASLSLLPQIVWESQRALTHSVLALAMSVLLVVSVWRVIRFAFWRDYVLLGVVIGLGLLSKYNFAVLPVGFLLAVIMLPECRARLRPTGVLVAVVLTICVVAPAISWTVRHPELATGSIDKFGLDAVGPVVARFQGAGAYIAGLIAFLALPIVVLTPFAWVRRCDLWPSLGGLTRLMLVGCLVTLLVLFLAILLAGATVIKDRWLLPIAWMLVPVAVTTLLPILKASQVKVLSAIILGLWLCAALLLPYASLRNPGYRAADFPLLLDRIAEIAPETELILSNRVWILGNLALLTQDRALRLSGEPPDEDFVFVASGTADEEMLSRLAAMGRPVVVQQHEIIHGQQVLPVTIIAAGPDPAPPT